MYITFVYVNKLYLYAYNVLEYCLFVVGKRKL